MIFWTWSEALFVVPFGHLLYSVKWNSHCYHRLLSLDVVCICREVFFDSLLGVFQDQVEEISTFQLRNHLLNGCNIAVINEARNCLLRRIAKQETFMVCDPTISSLFQLNQSPDTLFYMGLSSVNHFKYDSCMAFQCYTEDWKQFTCHFCSHISGSQITFVSLFI